MKHAILLSLCIIMLLEGCAHLEVPTKDVYPFRAEFIAQGDFQGKDMNMTGAVYLTSGWAGIIQTYLPGGLASYTIDILSDRLVIKDMWGTQMDMIKLPISGIAGLIAGDMPPQRYLYKEKTPRGIKVVYTWGVLHINDVFLPTEIHIQSNPAVDILFKPAGRNVTMDVNYGTDAIKILFIVKQGGRWVSS
jgi:hypothetical protein